MNAPLRILLVAALCIAALIGLVVRETQARASGTEVLLAMEAVDPRALLSGHYVIVALREQLPSGAPCPAGANEAWVALAPEAETHRVAGGGATRAEALNHGPLAARGSFECTEGLLGQLGVPAQPSWIALDLGVERFYINQGDAERIDRMLRVQTGGEQQRVFAIVTIGQDGRARLRGLQIDGERVELSWR